MNFVTEYKNINFHITLEEVIVTDVTLLLGDKFSRLPNQTMIELKKGKLLPFNLIIKSKKEKTDESSEEERTHYWSNVLLSNEESQDDLLEELGHYLDDEDILELIVANWDLSGDDLGPAWK